jgi:hypothetical protein
VKRDWSEVEAVHLGDECWACGSIVNVQWAHIVKRERDGRDSNGRRAPGVVRVNPHCIVPLCGPVPSLSSCHGRFDTGRLDLLPVLVKRAPEKVVAAVEALGLEAARRRLLPSDYTVEIERARGMLMPGRIAA